MPNWCYNFVEITGEPKTLKKLGAMMKRIPKDGRFFYSLIGINENLTPEEYEKNWYNENIERIGCKWDIDIDESNATIDDDCITLSFDTAWSPPISGFKHLNRIYGVGIKHFYSEPGCDFCGQTTISDNGLYYEEDYGYREGLYHFDRDCFWGEIESDTEGWLFEEATTMLEENKTMDEIESFVKEEFPYVTDDDLKEIINMLLETIKFNPHNYEKQLFRFTKPRKRNRR